MVSHNQLSTLPEVFLSLRVICNFFRSKGKAQYQAEPDLPYPHFLAFIPFILTQKAFRTNEEAAEEASKKASSFMKKDSLYTQ